MSLKLADEQAYIYKRYIWATDQGEIIDTLTTKPISPDKLRQRLQAEGHPLGNAVQFEEFLNRLRSMGCNLIDIRRAIKSARKVAKEETSTKVLIDEAYKALAPNLQLYNQPISGAIIYHYRDHKGEIHTLQKEKAEGFLAAIRQFEPLLSALESAYNSEFNENLRAALTMSQFVQSIYERYIFDRSKLVREEPQHISWNPQVFAYRQLDATMLQPNPTPTWDEFLTRLDHPEVFKAWVWAVFEPSNFGRQAMYMHGLGFDGKSSVIRAIASLLGERLTMSVDHQKLKDTNFFYGNVHGRRLILYPDCKVSNVLRFEVIKSMLGNDMVQVNKKNKEAFNSRIYARLIVGSNRYPKIDPNERSEMSRLLFIKVAAIDKNSLGDSTFEPRLVAELGAFLYQCREAYKVLCPTNMEIQMPETMRHTIVTECAGSEADMLEEFIDDRLEFGPDFKTPKTDVKKALREHFTLSYNSRESENAYDNLSVQLSVRGIESRKTTVNGKRVVAWIGVKLKPLVS